MEPFAPGFWLLPTHGRVNSNVPRFLKAALATAVSTPGYIVVDEEEYLANHEAYDALALPPRWTVWIVKGGGCAIATEQALKELMEPDTQWVGWLSDDLIPETMGWDVHVVTTLNGWNIVSTNDLNHAPDKFNGATAWSADVIRAVGYLFPPGMRHFYLDNVWEDVARLAGNWQCRMDVVVRHAHAGLATGDKDATFARTHKAWETDDRVYQAWKVNDLKDAGERVIALMQEAGVETFKPDLTGMTIMIATPVASGRVECNYVMALMDTMAMIRQYGGLCHWLHAPHISDISLARNRVFGAFLRSDDTHCLMIDDDMDWNPQDVIRLLLKGTDFVGVAGPRKVFPPSYAVNVADNYGRPIPLNVDSTTGMIEASGVGMAFTVITHRVAERMAQSYADLAFDAADGRVEYGVYNPMIVNRRYLSEDYAFCNRWRAIGGKVWVVPEISLGHIGSYRWSGAWLEALSEQVNQAA